MDRIIVKLRGAWDEGRVSAIIQACGVSDTGRRIPQIKRFLVRAADADAALVVLRAHPDVEHAARDALLAPAAYHVASNDPLLDSSWHMKRIGAFHAWKFTKGAGAVVAVADSGVVPHEDLPVPNVGVTGWNCLDPLGYTGGNTADVLDRYTYDEVGDTHFSHGTMCGSFVYGLHNNGLGVSGLAPEVTAKMYVCFAMPGVFLAEGADAIVRAADDGADAVSCSWGAGSDGLAGSEQIMADAVAYAHAAGTSVVVAAMNHGYNHETWTAVMIPAETPGVICVGATTDTSDRRATFSNYGSVVDIVAPGEWLPVPDISPTGGTGPFTYYKTAKGTSFSTPLVAAALGLIKSINPNLTRTQREAILLGAGADRIRDDYAEGDWPNAVALNAAKCALAALATVPANAGVVYPYIQFWGAGASTVVSGGVATTTLDGSVLFEARGYSSDPVTSVEVYVGSTLVYSGAPATLQATASNAGGAQAVRVVAYTATGQGEDTYTDIVVASLSNVTAYEHPGDVAFIGEKLPGVGNTYEPIGAGTVLATRVTVAERATLREFRVAWKTDAASMSFRVGIYTVGGDGKPANLVGQSVDYSGPVSDVSSTGSPVAVALAAPITLEPGDYFFAIHGGASAWVDVNYGRAGATALYRRQYAQAYGSGLPAPFGAALVETPASGSSTSDVKVFATYDPTPSAIPGTLSVSELTSTTGDIVGSTVVLDSGEYAEWTVEAAQSTDFRVQATAAGSGTVNLYADDQLIGSASSPGAISIPVTLAAGTRTLRLEAVAPPGQILVSGRNLVDSRGNTLIIRGVEQTTWDPMAGAFSRIASEIAATGANAVRLIVTLHNTSPAELDFAMGQAIANGLVVYVSPSKESGEDGLDPGWNHGTSVLPYWTTGLFTGWNWPEMHAVIDKYGPGMVILDALAETDTGDSEAGRDTWAARATTALANIRAAGYTHTVVLMGNMYGRDPVRTVQNNGAAAAAIAATDTFSPPRVIFGWQSYWAVAPNYDYYGSTYGPELGYSSSFRAHDLVPLLASLPFPVQIGLDYQDDVGITDYILTKSAAHTHGIGWLYWSWEGTDGRNDIWDGSAINPRYSDIVGAPGGLASATKALPPL